jgi:hypothetical protein
VLRSLDPHHARIGYLGALASVATRGLDITEALTARFHELLFERIYSDDPRYSILCARITDQERQKELERLANRQPEDDPSAILSKISEKTEWYYLNELWVLDACMPSATGGLAKDQLHRTVDLARWTGILLPTLELSEAGYLVQHLLRKGSKGGQAGLFNPLNPKAHPLLPLLYLRLMLNAEMLFPFLVQELEDRERRGPPPTTSGEHGLLRGAVERMLSALGERQDPEDILALRDVTDFQTSIKQKASTEENYLRPRLEFLVDMGLIAKKGRGATKGKEFSWRVTPTTVRLAQHWHCLTSSASGRLKSNPIPEYLEKEFFGSMAVVFDRKQTRVRTLEERLLWFARAFTEIGRDFGFTPGRSLSLLGCLLAWENDMTIEIEEMFDAAYSAAKTEWARFLHYSGGSRFDREFLIRIDKEALPALEEAVRKAGSGGDVT